MIPLADERVYDQRLRGYFGLSPLCIEIDSWVNNSAPAVFGENEARSLSPGMAVELEQIKHGLLSDPVTRSLFSGVHVPFFLPRTGHDQSLSEELARTLLPKVKRSYESRYTDYEFKDFSPDLEATPMRPFPGSRWEKLLNQAGKGDLVGWYFPTALAGFAIPDQRKLEKRLPEGLVVSGPLEAAAAIAQNPSLLFKKDDQYPHLLALTAVEPVNQLQCHMFWFFEAYGWNLNFNWRSFVGAPSEYYSGGLTIFSPLGN